MKADNIGLYVHIPFCVRKCTYCDFCSRPPSSDEQINAYISALCDEIRSYSGMNLSCDTVFFGGGTPSLLKPEQLEIIMNELNKSFSITADSEITLEANPGTASVDFLREFKLLGFNRISFGLQSIHENELKFLGRIHSYNDFLSSYHSARDAGFDNINVDLMYGLPEQTRDSFIETLRSVASLSPEHISVYGLILEEGTPLHLGREKFSFPNEDDECAMYYYACELLSSFGYSHYEISNYAKTGFECKHNIKYWKANEYVGLGLSAHSYLNKKRYSNTENINEYLGGKYRNNTSVLSKEDLEFEFAMLSLRLKDGFTETEFKARFGTDFISKRKDIISKMEKLGLVQLFDDRISLTEQGLYLSNSVLTELL